MMTAWSRRSVLGLMGAGAASLPTGFAFAQASGDVLARVRKAGVVKVGLVSAGAYGALKPDGSVDGLAPVIVKLVMERLGVPKVEGIVASYGELIPGLQAGRWDIIGAALAVTKARCDQVSYSDPFGDDYAAFTYLPSELPNPPKSIKELGERNLKVGISAGAYGVNIVRAAYKDQSNVLVFPDSPTILEAVANKRVQMGSVGVLLVKQMLAQKPGSFAYVGPMSGDLIVPMSAAFRNGDKDLIDAFQAEFRKMKQTGEWEKIVTQFGFEVFPGTKEKTPQQACEQVSVA